MIYILTTKITQSLKNMYFSMLDNMHDVTVVIDGVCNNQNNTNISVKYVDHTTLRQFGFTHLGKASKFKTCAFAYAIYLACNSDDEYSWFIEDDVIFSSNNTIKKLDESITADLLCRNHSHITESMDWLHWIEALHESPFELGILHRSLQCVCRCSKRLLDQIALMASSYKRLFYIEYILNTICAKNNFTVVNPSCMQGIFYKPQQQIQLHGHEIIHPVKNEDERLKLMAFQKNNESNIIATKTNHTYIHVTYDYVMNKLVSSLLMKRIFQEW